jgi:hypothetical protein
MKQVNIQLLKITLLIIVAMALVTTLSAQAQAQQSANVYLQPVEPVEGRLVVDVMAENVTDMYGAEFRLRYDPAVFAVQDADPNREGIQIEPGALLPADKGFVVANQVNEAEGLITFALTLLNPAPPATGSGPLARVAFTILQAGPSTIQVEKAKLVAINLQTIPSQTTPLIFDGAAPQAVAPQPQQATTQPQSKAALQGQTSIAAVLPETSTGTPAGGSFPWWIVAAGVMIMGAIGLGALVLFTSNLSKPQPHQRSPEPKAQQQPRPVAPEQLPQQQRTRQTSGTRPSAFK